MIGSKAEYVQVPSEDSAPPAYGLTALVDAEPLQSSTSPYNPRRARPVAAGRAASNQISIVHKNGHVTGDYLIDTSKYVPSAMLDRATAPLASAIEAVAKLFTDAAPKKTVNAFFSTSEGKVNVNLYVKGGGVAVIGVENKGHDAGGINLAIADRHPSTLLDLTLASSRSVRIAIPADFTGLIKGGAQKGAVTFSPSLQTRLVVFSVDQRKPSDGRYFLGDWHSGLPGTPANPSTSSALDGPPAILSNGWRGDVISVVVEGHSSEGIYIETWDERQAALERKALRKAKHIGLDGWWGAVCDTGSVAFVSCCVFLGACFGCPQPDPEDKQLSAE